MKTTLKLKAVVTKNNSTYYYAFNELLNGWQRISKDRFEDWLYSYFGLKSRCEIVSKKQKETIYLVTKPFSSTRFSVFK